MERMTATLDSTGTTAAVIVTHQRAELLRASLEKVVNQTHPVQWVIVVDNGAEDAVRDAVESLAGDRAVYVPSKTNLGGAGGFALGMLYALSLGADWVWLADDDGRPDGPAVLSTLLDCARTNDLDEVSPVVVNIDDPDTLAFPLRRGVAWRRKRSELFEGEGAPTADDDLLL